MPWGGGRWPRVIRRFPYSSWWCLVYLPNASFFLRSRRFTPSGETILIPIFFQPPQNSYQRLSTLFLYANAVPIFRAIRFSPPNLARIPPTDPCSPAAFMLSAGCEIHLAFRTARAAKTIAIAIINSLFHCHKRADSGGGFGTIPGQ